MVYSQMFSDYKSNIKTFTITQMSFSQTLLETSFNNSHIYFETNEIWGNHEAKI